VELSSGAAVVVSTNFNWQILAKETGRETRKKGKEKRRKVETEGGRKKDT
jgi:hypothetical protein